MIEVAVIGAGQLGSRHLQGLLKLNQNCHFHVVDPSPAALEIARTRSSEMNLPQAAAKVLYSQTVEQLPDMIDYAVIATTADVRLEVLRNLLANRRVHNLLLEKVLFQRLEDYPAATELITQAGAKSWVNCTRRAFPIYQQIKKFLEGRPLVYFHVYGGHWGMGCNAIHFLDLLTYLTESPSDEISTLGLQSELIPGKRPGFYEFTGSLTGYSGQCRFEIASLPNSSLPLLVTIRAESRTCVIDEAGGQAFFHDSDTRSWQRQEFKIPYLSELGPIIADQILVHGHSVLTPLDEAIACHLPLIRALLHHAEKSLGGPLDFCPIT